MKKNVLWALCICLITFILVAGCSNKNESNITYNATQKVSADSREEEVNNEQIDPNKIEGPIYDERISKDLSITEVIVKIGDDEKRPIYREIHLKTRENIKKVLDIHRKLETHEDQSIATMKRDVKLNYVLENGNIVTKKFEGIRPVEEYFGDVLDSLEAKTQLIDIFSVDPKVVKKAKFTSYKVPGDPYVWETNDLDIVQESFNNMLTHYRETNYYGSQTEWVTVADVAFLGSNDNLVARGIILKGEKQWDKLFAENENIKNLKINPEDVKLIKLSKQDSIRSVSVADKKTVKQILDSYLDIFSSSVEVVVEVTLNSGEVIHGSYNKGSIPGVVMDLFK